MRNPGPTKVDQHNHSRDNLITKLLETSKTNQFSPVTIIAIIAMTGVAFMRSVNVAELKNRLSKYLTFAKGGGGNHHTGP